MEPNNLQEMFEFSLSDEPFSKLWRLPDYIDELDYVAEFNDKNFGEFLLKHFGETYKPRPPSNTSKNKGFAYYRKKGEISQEMENKLFNHAEYKKFMRYIT